MKPIVLLSAWLFSVVVSSFATAQGDTNNPSTGAPQANASTEITFTGLYKYKVVNKVAVKEADSLQLSFGNRVIVLTTGEMVKRANEMGPELRLWINGACQPNSRFLFPLSDTAIVFRLARDTTRKVSWNLSGRFCSEIPVQMSLGTKTQEFSKHRKTIYLSVSSTGYKVTAAILIAGLLLLIVWYRKKWLRDTGLYTKDGVIIGHGPYEPTDEALGRINIKDLTYSLARFQFVVWFFIIFCCLVIIWACSGILMTPTGTTLTLLTLSGGTLLLGKVVDNVPTPPQPDPAGGNVPVAVSPQDIVKKFLEKQQGHKSFFLDLLSDGASVSFHRLQLLAFTVFLGVYFVIEVFMTHTMPQFDATMMGLMGISGATYVGVKTTEK